MLKRVSIHVVVLVAMGFCSAAFSQKTPFDGLTPKGLEPGAPAGSYALSSLDAVNLYNGSLSLVVPLLQIGGRGESGYTMSLPLNRQWTVSGTIVTATQQCPDPCKVWSYSLGGYADYQNSYRPAGIIARKIGTGFQQLPNCPSSPFFMNTLTRITVAFGDGT